MSSVPDYTPIAANYGVSVLYASTLIVNAKAAKALNLTIPAVPLRADEVIE